MSWGNELLPPKLSARTLWLDLKSAWSAYSEAHLPLRRRAVFPESQVVAKDIVQLRLA